MSAAGPAPGLSGGTILVLNVAVWGGWSLLVGYVGHRWPARAFEDERWWSRLRTFERGRFYATTLRIHAWKDRLPELGGFFSGGFPKRSAARSPRHLQRFVVETRRAEAVHWAVFWAWPIFALWNPWWAVLVILGYAAAANLPCVIVQRYNRGRLLTAWQRSQRLTTSRVADGDSARFGAHRNPNDTAPSLPCVL